ncbi:1-acyl-sn-glycerol-3-phosphate acyltransferase [candidate division WOR-3 bacterium]|nr:1-acyl-sn-glycerol-3-phosphate acyltransferase [candidate division WOR-3 bacterium]
MKWRWGWGWTISYPLFHDILGVKVHHRDRVPKKGAVLIAANHMNFIDPPLMGHAAKRECWFLAKEELFGQSRFFRWLITWLNAIPIKRGKGYDIKLFKQVKELLKKGQAIILFPEGTRSLKGDFLPFLSGVGMLALRYDVSVVPAYIKNTHRPVKEWITRKSQIHVYFGDMLYPDEKMKKNKDYEGFTQLVERAVHMLADTAWAGDDPRKRVRAVASPQIL